MEASFCHFLKKKKKKFRLINFWEKQLEISS